MTIFKRYVSLSLMLLGLSGCGAIEYLFVEETYEAPPEPLVEFTAEFEPKTLWRENTGDGSENIYADLSPWLSGDQIYTVDAQGDVRSMSVQNGRRTWRTELEVRVATGVGGGEGKIAVGSQQGDVIALNQTDGDILWKQRLSSEVLAPPQISGQYVVVRTADGRVSGMSAVDGTVLWNYQRNVPLLSLRGVSAPAIVGETVLAGYDNGKLVALSLVDGKVIWEKSVAVPRGRTELERLVDIDANLWVTDELVYVAAYQGNLAAYFIDTGDLIWQRDISTKTGFDVAIGEAVYLTGDESYLWAIQDGTGDSLWRQTRLLRRQITAPTIVGDYIVVGDLEGYVHWVARSDGRFVARQEVGDVPIRSQILVRDNVLYVIDTEGRLTAIQGP
ncbi:Outer membrane protein YfgL [Methylophaga frappieri]|uniref:Outer membrane protein assembly factor BamB n=1 Tax=Methylophaga frappieri (strain ATCC BAA-2434 / DSM 25690 / JAM7) TaxID=754477 RepID=I1YG36_METFJ|nr:outer membrane protein assembly factor BamB [Methylophaga frappieri]AFJ01879.1 Outer membrane protein YfgL [Methylophaga frappieri]